jgi:hypothetical protein
VRAVPRSSAGAAALAALLGVLAVAAALDDARPAAGGLAALLVALTGWVLWESALAIGAVADAVHHADKTVVPLPSRGRR